LFIGHDLATVAHISHRIAVMYLGQIVELADSMELCAKPLHPYTQALFTAALPADPDERHERLTITGEVPSALDPPLGCRFYPRCPHAMAQCALDAPLRKKGRPRAHRRLPSLLRRSPRLRQSAHGCGNRIALSYA
jgi:oligopeptide/dipeptide ABC transporter ATP-binding protein